jgi:hypothetical protein
MVCSPHDLNSGGLESPEGGDEILSPEVRECLGWFLFLDKEDGRACMCTLRPFTHK